MSRGYSSSWETVGSMADPDILYYNASIVNNNTDDLLNGFAFADPLIRFNETRDKAIIPDASKYQFSIVRFVMNGGNLDLPLFIPAIQSYTGQTDPNLTEYGVGITLFAPLTNIDGSTTEYKVCPNLTYLEFTPENYNPQLAPVPLPPCSPDYVGSWLITNAYIKNAIVDISNQSFYFQATVNVPANTALNATYVDSAGVTKPYWVSASPELGRPQDVSTRYYWMNSYQTMVNMMNTALVQANFSLYSGLLSGWIAHGAGNTDLNFPYTFETFSAAFPPPVMSYDIASGLFSIAYPDVYLNPNGSFTRIGLWFNANTYGLFANFPSQYYNTPTGDGTLGPALVPPPGPFLPGYAYRMSVQYLGLGSNVVDISGAYPPVTYTGRYFVRMTQEYISTSTLWSPIDSIVFISNLLPIQNEQTAPPNTYGNGNVGNSTAVSKSAFQPIITDITNDLSVDPTGFRKMIYYAPTAEYRMADFQNSKAEIKNIDIQLFWKNRLNNQLYPISMYNLSSVSFKMMFRKKNALMGMAKGERNVY